MSAGHKTRVAVLGGGAGAMAAAFELLRTPERRQALDVTIYQMGWRLGGKGASGRNQKRGQRIEEHGLHLWFGFYDNAFRVMGDAYATVDRPPTAPLATLWKAFAPCHQIVLYDRYDGQWSSEYFDVPTDDRKPGHSPPTGVLPGHIIHETVRYLDGRWRSIAGGAVGLMVEAVDKVFDEVQTHTARRRAGQDLVAHEIDEAIAEALKVARALVWHHVKDHLDHAEARHFFQLLDIVTSAWCGIVAERVFERGFYGHRRPRLPAVAGPARRLRRHRRDRRPGCRRPPRLLRPRLRLRRRRHGPARPGRRPRPPGAAQDRVRLQGFDHVADAGRHGRRRLRAVLRGSR